ncbi:unnamed protein product [Prunus armeniaca]
MAVHRNLLRLRGFCTTQTERLLVYPYMANGSVASCLRDRTEAQPPLDWEKRKRIALGSARGLAYLHDHCDPKIIHRDVKAANIFVFKGMPSRASERASARGERKTPEASGCFASCTFSAGKALTPQCFKAYASHSATKNASPIRLAFENIDIDDEVEQLIQVALLCTQGSPGKRLKMSEVVQMLGGDGLAERWEAWQKEEMFDQDFNPIQHASTNWIMDSSSQIPPDVLSGPR